MISRLDCECTLLQGSSVLNNLPSAVRQHYPYDSTGLNTHSVKLTSAFARPICRSIRSLETARSFEV